ncbi:hypothetical protein [Agromyces sp. NPDC058064]|uniref:hypothetical protein n=1 Tax=Agromyces sp. NPDC058064 TaxID=3346322 RepID=UPI0036DF818A
MNRAPKSTSRRIQRVWGVGALVGVVLFAVGLAALIVVGAAGGETDAGWIVGPTFAGLVVIAGCWPVWSIWSSTLDRAEKRALQKSQQARKAQRRAQHATAGTDGAPSGAVRLERTPTVTLWMLALVGIGAMLLLASGLPFLLVEDGSDALAVVLFAMMLLGASMIGFAIAFSAIAGGIALGGGRWWWVGVIFDLGFVLTVWGISASSAALWVPGAAVLAGSAWGYTAALRDGLRQGREDAIEAKLQKDRGTFV